MEKKELLAKFLEIDDLDQIEEASYDDSLFIVNPHTKKIGDSPDQKLAKINLVKQALDRVGLTKDFLFSENFTLDAYKDVSKLFYAQCGDLTKIGIHDLINTLYFLCGGSVNQPNISELTKEYRNLYDGKEIEDNREDHQVSDGEYLVLDDYEADEKFEEYCRSYIDDCMEIPENMKNYFDEEKFINDVRDQDGRGILSSYDSCEYDIVDPDSGTTFYIYRTN